MVGWHHQLNGHEFEQTLRNSEGWGSLGCCSPWGHKELDSAERLNKNNSSTYLTRLLGGLNECKGLKIFGTKATVLFFHLCLASFYLACYLHIIFVTYHLFF